MINLEEVQMQKKTDLNIKIVLLGDGAVGLTSMIKMYLFCEKYTDYTPTVLDKYQVKVQVRNKIVDIEFVDTPGQPDFKELRASQFKDTDGKNIYF